MTVTMVMQIIYGTDAASVMLYRTKKF